LLDAQVNAVRGDLPERVEMKGYAAKAITFAKREGIVLEGFEMGSGIVDIPEKGRILKHGEPIATGIGIGKSRKDACAEAMERVAWIQAGVRYL
jgi:predicted ATP-grasp superfamily ATP-dependent carboligase